MKKILYLTLRTFSSLQHFLFERLTPAGWLVLAAAGTAAGVGVDTNRTMSYQAFALLASVLLVALLLAPLFRAKVTVRRELPRYATAGERFEYRVVVENLGKRALRGFGLTERLRDPRPSYSEWRDAREPGEARRNWVDRAGGYFRWRWLIERKVPERTKEAPLPEIAPGARESIKLGLRPRRRGRIELAGLTLGRADPLGLVRGLRRLRAEGSVIALPRRYRLPPLALPGQRRFQQGGVTLATSVGDSEEFIGLREYRPGDPLQKLHWKSYARTGVPIVKEFQDEFFERHALVLDTSSGTGEKVVLEERVFEEAVAVAASFVYAIDTRECLLDLLLVGGEVRTYTAGRGQMQMQHMLEVLAGVAPSRPADFAALARAVLGQRGSLSSCIVVLLAWDQERKQFIENLSRTGVEVRALVVSENEFTARNVTTLKPGEIEAGLAKLR